MTQATRPQPSADDYKLVGGAGERAAAAGLVNATWYKCAVPRAVMKDLMQRNDARAIRDTALWYALIVAAGSTLYSVWADENAGASMARLVRHVSPSLLNSPSPSNGSSALRM